MNVSVVIVSYRTPDLLRQCLNSLESEAPDVRDIIVVDNASGDNTQRVLQQEFPHVKRIASRVNAGFSRGVNWGLANAKNEFVLILNPDILLHPGSLQKLYDEICAEPRIGLIAPKLVNPDNSLQLSCLRWQTPGLVLYRRTPLGKTSVGKRSLDEFQMRSYGHEEPRDVDWVIGGCMLVRKSAVDEIGSMDERFFMYFEDMDWCRRLWQNGWRVRYEPRSVMTHHHQRLSGTKPGLRGLLNPLGRVHLKSGLKYFAKHLGNGRSLNKMQADLIDK